MKKLILLLAILPMFAIAQQKIEAPTINVNPGNNLFSAEENQVNNATAVVEQVDGIFIFAYCKPFKKYRVIGTVKPGYSQNEYEFIAERLVRKLKKNYPTAQGLIINIDQYARFKDCEVIEFID